MGGDMTGPVDSLAVAATDRRVSAHHAPRRWD